MRCSNCQANLPEQARFCAYCGKEVALPEQKPRPAPPPVQAQPIKQTAVAQPQPVKQSSSCVGCVGMSIIIGLLVMIALFLLFSSQQTTIMAIIQLIEESIPGDLPLPNQLPEEAKQAIQEMFNDVPSYEQPKPYQIVASQRATRMAASMDELWCVVVEVYSSDQSSYHGALLVYRQGAYWGIGSGGIGILAPRYFQELDTMQMAGCTIANGYELLTREGRP